MAGGYLNNLVSSFGIPMEGPDPSRLQGLLECLRDPQIDPEELTSHLLRMQARIREARRDRQGAFEGQIHRLGPEASALIERNLSACQVLDETLGVLADELLEEQVAIYERASQEFLESCDQLAELGASSRPVCPRCGSRESETLCATCQLDCLIPDPDVGQMEYNRASVGEEFLAVYQAYVSVIEGQAGLEPLLQALQSLEFSLLEAQALAEQAAEGSPPHEALLNIINQAVEGVDRMHAVQDNRLTRELHQGWAQVFRAAVVVQQLLASAQNDQGDSGDDQNQSEDPSEDD